MSMRRAQVQREPAGRFTAGGSGAAWVLERVSSGTGRSDLSKGQLAGCGVVIENLGVAPPLNGGFQLAAGLVFAEMFVEEVAEKFIVEGAIGFGFERLLHLAEQGHMGEGGFAEDGFARLNVCLGEGLALGSNDGVALLDAQESEENGGVHAGEKRVNFQAELIGELVEIGAATLVGEDFEQTRQAAW